MPLLPDLDELLALRGAARGLDLHAHRPALARLAGGHRSAQRGRGLEFEEVRPYAVGDDARNIDWRVTARRGRVHTKLFREERERPVWLLADLHPGLFFGSRRQLQSALLVRAAALLAWAAAGGGDRLGALLPGLPGDAAASRSPVARALPAAGGAPLAPLASGRPATAATTVSAAGPALPGRPTPLPAPPRIFAPRAREAGVLPVLQALVEAQPRAPGPPRPQGLAEALAALRPLLQPGSLLLVLSDFAGLDDAAESLLAPLAARSECRLVWITDPLQARGLPDGAFRVGLPGRSWWLDGGASRKAWRAAWDAREARLRGLAARLALPLARLETAADASEALRALLQEPRWAA
ncbi:MAG: DUF58 domain-containing protein [Burkholderiales bacterium]|nr:DUF58 domain-containing protein [Burkholderiales bacterium]